MSLALSIALGIILVPIIVIGFVVLLGASVSAGDAVAENTRNPLFGALVGIGIFVVVIGVIVSCVG